jgi:protocatechuate 3,4-dioxygenase beta subunit
VAFRLDEDVALEETQSGPDGAYAMDAGPSGTKIGVFAKLAGYTMAEVAEAMMSGENDGGEKLLKPENDFPAGTTTHRDLPMLGGALLSGRVVDQATGQGIVGAEIMVRPLFGVEFIAFADPIVTRSGADGAFAVAPIGVGKFAVTAEANGWVAMGLPTPEGEEDPEDDERVVVEIRSGGVANVALRLRRGAEIAVHVTDPDGHPLAGASVSWMIPDERLVELFGPKMRPRAVATDAAGKAVIGSLPPRAAVLLAARHPDYPAGGHVTIGTAPLPDKPVVIAVVRASSLAGVVIGADGRPAANREVNVSVDDNSVPRVFGQWSWMVHRAATDAAGRFLIENLPPGPVTIAVGGGMIARNHSEDSVPPDDEVLADPAQASIELRAGKREEVSLRLIRTQSISGRVTDASGRAIAGVMIHATAAPGHSVQGEFWSQSEDDGAYRLGSLPPGSYQLEAILNAEAGPKKQTRVVTAGASGVDFRIE